MYQDSGDAGLIDPLYGVPAAAQPQALGSGDYVVYRGDLAILWMRIARKRERSTYYVTVREGLRNRQLAEEPVSSAGWQRILAAFALADPAEWERREAQAARQLVWDELDGNELDIRVGGAFLIGGFGLEPFAKAKSHTLRFGDDAFVLSLPRAVIRAFSYADLMSVAVDGEAVTTGGGFIGGGFGVAGAAEGLAIASVLNALTTRTDIRTILEVQTAGSHFVFLSTSESAKHLATRLLPVQAELRTRT